MAPAAVARLKGAASKVARWVVSEWVVVLGGAAVASLLFLWPYVPTPGHWRAKDQRVLDLVDFLVRHGRAQEGRDLAQRFIRRRPGSSEVARAHYLSGLAALGLARRDSVSTGRPVEALDDFAQAHRHGFDAVAVTQGYRDVAQLHESHRRYTAAVGVYEQLNQLLPDVDDLLRLAWATARAARLPGAPADLTVERALERVTAYEEKVGPDRMPRAAAERARILALHDRLDEAMTVVNDAFIAWPDEEAAWRFHLMRGKIHRRLAEADIDRLYHYEEAQRDFDEAARRAPEAAEARYFEGDAFRGLGSKQAEARLRAALEGPPGDLAALANLVLGRYRLETGTGEALGHFVAGFDMIEGPGVFDRFDFDFAEYYDRAFLPMAQSEGDPGRLGTIAQILVDIRRLFPTESRYRELRESTLVRAARGLKVRAAEVRETGDLRQAEAIERLVGETFRAASEEWLELAEFPGIDSASVSNRRLRAAHRLAEGRLYLEAATLYKAYYDVNPKKQAEGALFEGLCLHRAGLLVESAGRSGALEALERFRRDLPPNDPLAAYVTIELGRVLIALGRYADAQAALRGVVGLESPVAPVTTDDYFRIHGDANNFDVRALGVDPSARRPLWGTALLELGRAGLFRSRELSGDAALTARQEAEDALLDFKRRYMNGAAPPDAMEVHYTLGQLYREWGRSDPARAELESAVALTPVTDDEAVHARTANYILGDLALERGDFPAARDIYRRAFRRYDGHADSVWAKLGLAEVARRTGKPEEAQDHLEGARRHFEEHARDGEMGPVEFEYWKRKL